MPFSPSSTQEHALLAHAIRQGRVVLFTGAGFSCDAANRDGNLLGTAKELKQILTTQFSLPESVLDHIYDYRLDELCEYITGLEQMNADDPRNPLCEFLRGYYSQCNPKSYHYKYDRFPWRRIFTTNIDDVLERIYSHSSSYSLQIRNSKSKEGPDHPGKIPYFKLHGCVKNITEPFVFTRRQYIEQMIGGDYRYDTFCNDFGAEIFLFVGTSLNEQNLEYFLRLKQRHNVVRKENEVFVVTTDDDPLRINQLSTKFAAVTIPSTAEGFINQLTAWCKGVYEEEPSPIDDEIIPSGLESVRSMIRDSSSFPAGFRCFLGYEAIWNEINAGALVNRRQVSEIIELAKESFDRREGKIIILVGRRGSGKTTALKLIAKRLLDEIDHQMFEWVSSDQFPTQEVAALISRSTTKGCFTLICDNASIHYYKINEIAKKLREENTSGWLFILAERTRSHNLESIHLTEKCVEEISLNPFYEKVQLWDRLDNYSIGKPHLLRQAREGRINRRIADISSCLYAVTESDRLLDNWRNALTEYDYDYNSKSFLLSIAILDFLDFRKIPSRILDQWLPDDLMEMMKEWSDFLGYNQPRSNLINIWLTNGFVVDVILDQFDFDRKLAAIKEMTRPIISQLEDSKHDTIGKLAEYLLKFSNLRRLLKIKRPKDPRLGTISAMYEELGQFSSSYSYILVQWALLSQYRHNYREAEYRLLRAQEIHPRSYQVAHAYANNNLRWSLEEQDAAKAVGLFNEGMRIMTERIFDSDIISSRGEEYALHSLVVRALALLNDRSYLRVPTEAQKKEIARRVVRKIREEGVRTSHMRDMIRRLTREPRHIELGAIPLSAFQEAHQEAQMVEENGEDIFE